MWQLERATQEAENQGPENSQGPLEQHHLQLQLVQLKGSSQHFQVATKPAAPNQAGPAAAGGGDQK